MWLFLIMILFICLGRVVPKHMNNLARKLDEKNEFEQDYKDRTLRALERMSSAVPEEQQEEEKSALDCFIEGNKKVLEKREVRRAMKDELGIY